jgi:hypothetical protein
LQDDFRQTVCTTFINTHQAADPLRQTSADNHSEECDMSVPQKEKESPASMLRAMFAGVGSLLSVVDRVRGKSAAQAPANAPAPAAPAPAAPAPAAPAPVAETVTPEETAAPETVVAETVTPEAVAPEATTTELPLANYDESTVASLRARLRNLSVDQLTQLIEYEKGHAARADVITMFERRIAKVAAEA